MNNAIPVKLTRLDNRWMVSWTKFETNLLQDNFFPLVDETQQWLTPLHELQSAATANESQSNSLKGIIYHCSRCGSRALTRMLNTSPQINILAEPPLLNQLLLHDVPDEQRLALIQGFFSAITQVISQNWILKTSSWNIKHLSLLTIATSKTPSLFIYRDPLAVINSLLARPPHWLQNHHQSPLPLAELACIAAQHVLETFNQGQQTKLKLFNHAQLPSIAWQQIASHFDLRIDDVTQQAMATEGRLGNRLQSPRHQHQVRPLDRKHMAGLLGEQLTQTLQLAYERLEHQRTLGTSSST